MKKLSMVLTVLMIVVLLCSGAEAKTIAVYEDWTITPYDDNEWSIDSYLGTEEEITLLNRFGSINIVGVNSYAFANNTLITSVTALQPMRYIDEYAFTDAAFLQQIVLPPSIVSIGTAAFSGTSSLHSINLQDTKIKEVSAYTFLSSGIEEITLPGTCLSIADNAFAQCDSLTKIVIPASVTEIGDDAFRDSENIVVCAPYGSYAIEYAKSHGIEYSYSDLEEYTFKRGDADGDNEITILDATRVQRHLAHFTNTDPDGRLNIRVAQDSSMTITILDATRIQRYLARFNDPYHIGETATVLILPDGTIMSTTADEA